MRRRAVNRQRRREGQFRPDVDQLPRVQHAPIRRVVDALATLAFDYPRRADFFRGELKDLLLLARASEEKSFAEGQRLSLIRELDTEVAAMCILGTIKQFVEQLVMMDVQEVDVDRMALSVLDFNLRGLLRRDAES